VLGSTKRTGFLLTKEWLHPYCTNNEGDNKDRKEQKNTTDSDKYNRKYNAKKKTVHAMYDTT